MLHRAVFISRPGRLDQSLLCSEGAMLLVYLFSFLPVSFFPSFFLCFFLCFFLYFFVSRMLKNRDKGAYNTKNVCLFVFERQIMQKSLKQAINNQRNVFVRRVGSMDPVKMWSCLFILIRGLYNYSFVMHLVRMYITASAALDGLALDIANANIYYTDAGDVGKIGEVSINGTHHRILVTERESKPRSIVLGLSSRYNTEQNSQTVSG